MLCEVMSSYVSLVCGSSELSAASDEYLLWTGNGVLAVPVPLEEGRHVGPLSARSTHLLHPLRRRTRFQGQTDRSLSLAMVSPSVCMPQSVCLCLRLYVSLYDCLEVRACLFFASLGVP